MSIKKLAIHAPWQRADGRWRFEYVCPLTFKKTSKTRKTRAAINRAYNAVVKLQQEAPEAPEKALTPFGTVIQRYLEDRVADAKSGAISHTHVKDIERHLTRLRPWRLEPIQAKTNGSFTGKEFEFKAFCPDRGQLKKFGADTLEEAEFLVQQVRTMHRQRDTFAAEKEAMMKAPIGSLDGLLIKKIFAEINRSSKTMQHYYSALDGVIKFAIKNGYLYKTQGDIVEAARPKSVASKEIVIPSAESVNAILQNADDFWHVFFAIKAAYGPRAGELCGLRWENVHQTNRKNWIVIREALKKDGHIGPPKTKAGIREIPLDNERNAMLRAFKREGEFVFGCPEFSPVTYQRNQWGHVREIPPHRLREPGECRPMTPDEVWRYGLRPLLTKHNIQWTGRLHVFRHFAASSMIEQGMSVIKVQKRLGHAKASTTLNIYGHLWDRLEFGDEAESVFGNLASRAA